ncbi:MAG TPA: hypothetical protein VFP80_13145 [Thermoanaerobaculia bacterium]|nr:hypothetical protein [Thermoanaerobaculia bacterium]
MSEEDLVYWRTLAEERGRALHALHARLRNALAAIPDEHAATFAAALSGRAPGWTRELDRMEPLYELRAADADTVLAELWTRVANDGGR